MNSGMRMGAKTSFAIATSAGGIDASAQAIPASTVITVIAIAAIRAAIQVARQFSVGHEAAATHVFEGQGLGHTGEDRRGAVVGVQGREGGHGEPRRSVASPGGGGRRHDGGGECQRAVALA